MPDSSTQNPPPDPRPGGNLCVDGSTTADNPHLPALPEHLRGYPETNFCVGQLGHPDHFYNQRVDDVVPVRESDLVINYLAAAEKYLLGNPGEKLDHLTPLGDDCRLLDDRELSEDDEHLRDRSVLVGNHCRGNDAELFISFIVGKSQADPRQTFGNYVHTATNATPTTRPLLRTPGNNFTAEELEDDDGDARIPHSDHLNMPWMEGWQVQANPAFTCGGPDPTGQGLRTEEGDCHCQVFNKDTSELTESWKCFGPGHPPGRSPHGQNLFSSGSMARWDMTQAPLRREQGVDPETTANPEGFGCTSPWAYGGPQAPMVLHASETLQPEIKHALWGVTLNAFFEGDTYVKITEATGGGTHNPTLTTSNVNWLPGDDEFDPGDAYVPDNPADPENAANGMRQLVYGSRMRLKKGACPLPDNAPPYVGKIVTALENYGMIMGDGSNGAALQFGLANDINDSVKWEDVGMVGGAFDLEYWCNDTPEGGQRGISWSDFELVSRYDNLGSMADTPTCERVHVVDE